MADRSETEVYKDTLRHIDVVSSLIFIIIKHLQHRAYTHDGSKLKDPEYTVFEEHSPKLKSLVYGSLEYKNTLEEMSSGLAHHYRENRHHPEHFERGIEDMNLIDLIEMVCDWKASTLRTAGGDIFRSVEVNTERFNISPQLKALILNTVDLFVDTKGK